jgi:hypothetical protein
MEVFIREHISDAFSTHYNMKQEDALLPLLFSFVIRKVKENQEGLELNGTYKK